MLKQNTPEFKALTSISMNVLVCFLTGLPIKVLARSQLLLTSFLQGISEQRSRNIVKLWKLSFHQNPGPK